MIKVFKNQEEFNENVQLIAELFESCHQTIISILKEKKEVEVTDEYEYRLNCVYSGYDGVFQATKICLNKKGDDFCIEAICSEDELEYEMTWDDINDDMNIIMAILDLLFESDNS